MKGIECGRPGEPWVLWLDELRREKRNCKESARTITLSQDALDDPVKFDIERPVIPGILETGIVTGEENADLRGGDLPRLYARWRFDFIEARIERLFDASHKLCLDFEASAWLSQVWRRLDLPTFARGPKK